MQLDRCSWLVKSHVKQHYEVRDSLVLTSGTERVISSLCS